MNRISIAITLMLLLGVSSFCTAQNSMRDASASQTRPLNQEEPKHPEAVPAQPPETAPEPRPQEEKPAPKRREARAARGAERTKIPGAAKSRPPRAWQDDPAGTRASGWQERSHPRCEVQGELRTPARVQSEAGDYHNNDCAESDTIRLQRIHLYIPRSVARELVIHG